MLELNVPNNLRNGKLEETVNTIVETVKAGEVVLVQNSGEFAVSAVRAVETAKQKLKEEGVKLFQTNRLMQNEVYLPEIEAEPLAKSKIHHNQVKLMIQLSKSPIESTEEGDTQQVIEPVRSKTPGRENQRSTV